MFKGDITMPVRFRKEADLSKLKQAPYNLSNRDKEEVDKILNPLVDQGRIRKLKLREISAAASPAFVVRKNGKPRVDIDLRKVNMALYPDAYSLPRQDTILGSLGGGVIFSSIDLAKGFFQQPIAEQDQ